VQKTIRILIILATLQSAMAVAVYLGSSSLATAPQGETLLSFDPEKVNGITIRDGHGTEIRLTRNGHWHLADGFPADSGRITRLLDRLHTMKHGLAAAISPAARERFSVSAKNFERHLTLFHGKQALAGLYLGRGAGARRSYVRADEGQATYSVELGSYDLPVEVADWQDKTVLQIRGITALEAGGVRIEKREGADVRASRTWRSDKTPKGKKPDVKAIERAVSLLETLRFTKSLGRTPPAGYDFSQPALSFSVRWKSGRRQYRFARHVKDDLYVLKVSDRPEYFEIAGYVFDGLKAAITPKKWFAAPGPQTNREKRKPETPSRPDRRNPSATS